MTSKLLGALLCEDGILRVGVGCGFSSPLIFHCAKEEQPGKVHTSIDLNFNPIEVESE